MSHTLELVQQALWLAVSLSLPVLAAALAAGAIAGLFAAASQVQDPAVTFVPRWTAVVAVIATLGASGALTLLHFTTELWTAIPSLVR